MVHGKLRTGKYEAELNVPLLSKEWSLEMEAQEIQGKRVRALEMITCWCCKLHVSSQWRDLASVHVTQELSL